MAVMQNMRENTKKVLIILVVAFVGMIIFDWGMDLTGMKTRQGVIGKVNGTEISATQFDEGFARELQAYRDRTGRDVPEGQIDFIRDQVWESLVRDVLIHQAIREKNITATDDEIVYRIFNDPPEFLKSQENFQNEQKQFDMALYQSALNNPSYAGQWQPVEQYLRLTIPYEKFQQRLRVSVRVTEDEIRREYLKQNEKVKVKYIFIDSQRYSEEDIEVLEDEVKAYYHDHKEEFREEEKRKIEYVIFSTKATAEDSSAAWETARSLKARAQEGEDFVELAEIYSEDPGTKDKGGDLGFFSKGEMRKPFEEAAYSAKVGGIVGPIATTSGIHVIKVDDKRIKDGKEEVSARHILIKFEASRNTIDRAQDDAVYVAEEAQERPFDEVIKEMNLKSETTNLFVRGNGFIPGLGLNKRASNFIFSNQVGKVGSRDETAQGYSVFRIAEVQRERIQPLDEVGQRIEQTLLSEKRKKLTRDLAEDLYKKIQSGLSFEDAAAQDSLELNESNSFNRNGYVQGVGREPRFVGAAFALGEVGDVSTPVATVRGNYLLQLTERTEFDSSAYEATKAGLDQQLLQRKRNQVFANWYANVKAKADIEDQRDKYYY